MTKKQIKPSLQEVEEKLTSTKRRFAAISSNEHCTIGDCAKAKRIYLDYSGYSEGSMSRGLALSGIFSTDNAAHLNKDQSAYNFLLTKKLKFS